MSKWIICIGSVLVAINTMAQHNVSTDTIETMVLNDVIIYEDLLKSAEIGLSATQIDSTTLSQAIGTNISDLLRNTAAGQIRSYGTNGLSSPSFRGTGASHTAILWNGINLQSPLSGGQDLSLLPNGFADEVTIQKGGTSSLYGSGAIGGSIQLNNKAYFNKGLELSTYQKMGSFANHFQSYSLNWSNHNVTNSTLFFVRNTENDFEYFNNHSNPPKHEKRGNAGVNQKGVLQQNDWKINNYNVVGIKVWYQDNAIEIPNSILTADEDEAVQNDEFLRSMLNWNYDRNNLTMTYKQAILWQGLHYVPSSGDPSTNDYLTWINRLQLELELPKSNQLILGLNHSYDQASVDAFGTDLPTRNSTALFASLRSNRFSDKLLIAINTRQELVDGSLVPFTPSLGLDYQLFKSVWLKGNASKNYRLPTFNDLYWLGESGAGNKDLKAEASVNLEAGISYRGSNTSSPFDLKANATFYNYLVDNWIQWQPITGNIWSPRNLKQVLSRGFETQISGIYDAAPYFIGFDLAYNYTKTTNNKIGDNANHNELNKQLTYTPLHEASLNFKLGYKKCFFTVNHINTGQQYSEGENKDRFALDAYHVTNLTLNQSVAWKKMTLSGQLSLNNMFDIAYENRRGYPMYGRNYSIGLAINFNNK